VEAIKLVHLTRSFGTVRAVEDLNFTVEPGEIFGLVGPDGAGKTTTMRLLTGVMEPNGGEAWVMGKHVVREAEEVKEDIGYMSQRFGLYPDLTVEENIHFYADLYGVPTGGREHKLHELLSFSNLTPFKKRQAGRLSGGMKQKLGLVCALIHTPKVLFLDEPTAGVDVELRQTLWQFVARLNKEGHTVLLTTHYLEEAEALCQRIAMLKQGRVVALDRTSALLAGTASTMLRFKMDQALPPALAAQSRVTGRIVQVKAHDAAEVETILAALRGAGCKPEDLEIGRADLEDVFLDIMQGHA